MTPDGYPDGLLIKEWHNDGPWDAELDGATGVSRVPRLGMSTMQRTLVGNETRIEEKSR